MMYGTILLQRLLAGTWKNHNKLHLGYLKYSQKLKPQPLEHESGDGSPAHQV